MIIDDDPSMLWFVTEIFVGPYNVVPLSSAEEALKQLGIQLPDLIISDVMMPEWMECHLPRRSNQISC